jgi:NTE family protein
MTDSRAPEPDPSRRPATEPRLRRFPAGDPRSGITIALGGGFSRGFAHLGVLEVLEQEKIPVFAIVGTSIGGLLGAAYADGISTSDLCDLGRRVRLRDFLRFHHSNPKGQERRKDCICKFVQEWFHAERLEELSIPTAIVATDLDSGAPYVFTKGPVELAIRAGCAFPGLVRPVKHDGRVLADGCITAPVPTEIAARMHGGCVLGVRVDTSVAIHTPTPEAADGPDPFFGAERRRSLEPSWTRGADMLLEPRVHQIDWNDFSRVDEAFSAGVEAMRRALPSLRGLLAQRAQLPTAPDISTGPERGLSL